MKDPIKSKFGQDNKVSKASAELEDNPASKGGQTILAESMAQEKLDRNPELIHFARQLVRALEETEQGSLALAKYQIDVMGDLVHIEGGVHFHKATAGSALGGWAWSTASGTWSPACGRPVDGRRAHHKTIIAIRGQFKKEVPNEENEKFHGGA